MARYFASPDGFNVMKTPLRKLNRCYHCKYGAGFIFPEAEDGKKAIQKADGSWLCYPCQVERLIGLMNPNHPAE